MSVLPIAAIVVDDEMDAAMQLLWDMAAKLESSAVKVAGLLPQVLADGSINGDVVVSVPDAQRSFKILQTLGSASTACRLNSSVLAASSMVLKEAIEQGKEFIFINKFGIAEAEGRGLLNEFSTAVVEGIPTISTVQRKYLEAWREFTGGLGTELQPDAAAVQEWIVTVVNNSKPVKC